MLALAATVGGSVVAYNGYERTAGPQGVVRGYFAALARSDAASALGFGELPGGPHNLLSGAVLHEQERIAPISQVHIVGVQQRGAKASVTVRYRLGFASGARQASDVVAVYERGSTWRLARTAIATTLQLGQALDRATILGGAVPDGPTLLFPGAVPLRFDTAYLELDPAHAEVHFDAGAQTQLTAQVSAAGGAAVRAALGRALDGCLTRGAKADPRCPLPSERYVPGSLRGVLAAPIGTDVTVHLLANAAGVIAVEGGASFRGSAQVLDFDDVAVTRTGTVQLQFAATTYATKPLVIQWSES